MKSKDQITKEERVEYWEMVISEFKESGQTKSEYCGNNDIPVSTFNSALRIFYAIKYPSAFGWMRGYKKSISNDLRCFVKSVLPSYKFSAAESRFSSCSAKGL